MKFPIGATVDIAIDIVRWHDDTFPGVVKCRLVDAHGKGWTFVEKAPYVTEVMLEPDSAYPLPGTIRGIVVASRFDADGQEILTVDTEQPWRIETTDGDTRFDVRRDQLTLIPTLSGSISDS